MGVEWINRTQKNFHRSMAIGRSSLLTPRLLDAPVGEVERSFRIQMQPDTALQPGAKVLLRAMDKSVAMLDGNERVIGRAESAPDWVARVVEGNAEGIALGVVDDFNSIACIADVRLQMGTGQ